MSGKNGRTTGLEEFDDISKITLPPSPVAELPVEQKQDLYGARHPEGREVAYIPVATEREFSTSLTFRLPVTMKQELKEIAEEYHTDMSKIIVENLAKILPTVPRKRKKN